MKIKRNIINLLLLIIICLFGQNNYSQDISIEPITSFEKINLPGGPMGNSVQSIIQDSIGFMWYASKNGLHRWDGYQFKTYQNDPSDATSISGNYVEYIYLAKDGSLWLSVTRDSENMLLDHFDPTTEIFHHYDYQPDLNINHDAYSVTAIVEDTNGNIWTGTQFGVYKLDIKTKKFKQYLNDPEKPNSLSHNICRSIYKDRDGILWFGTGLFWDQSEEGGLNRYRPQSDDFVHYFHDPNDANSLKSNVITEIFEDSGGNLWIGTIKGGLHKMDKEKGTFHRIPEPADSSFKSGFSIIDSFVKFIHEDQENKLWIGYYDKGLLYYDPVTETKKLFEVDKNIRGSLPEIYLWSIYQSRDGTLWVSTTGPESVVFKIKQSDFNAYKLSSSTNFVGALCESKDKTIWIATHENELYQFDLKTNELKLFKPNVISSSTLAVVNDIEFINKNEVFKNIEKIVEDPSGGLWMIKDLYSGIIYFNPMNEIIKTYSHNPNEKNSISEGKITDILKDGQGRIWLVSSKGELNLFETAEDSFAKFKNRSITDNKVGVGYDCKLTLSANGYIIVVGTGEKRGQLLPFINHFNPIKNEFINVNMNLTSSELFLIDKKIIQVTEGGNDHIWFCNQSHLIDVNPSTGLLKIYEANQFGTEYLKGMEIDHQGRLWIIGENISFFDPLMNKLSIKNVFTNTIKNFPSFKQTTLRTADGLIYIGGVGGFISFTSNLVSNNYSEASPESIITNFQLLDQTGKNENSSIHNLRLNSNIHLNYDQNTFSIRFATLSFHAPQENKIQYKLDGFDEQWRTAGLDPFATYIKVPPGDYNFLVKGATVKSNWGNEQEISIHISPPIWATWWAYSFYILMTLGFFYSFYKFQLNKKLEKAEVFHLKEINSTKNRLFTNISHEFRTPLTVISGMSSQIKDNPDKWLDEGVNIIEQNCKRLLDLVNQMLDLNKLESGKLRLQLVQSDIISFVKNLCQSFYSLTEKNQITLTIYSETEELLMDFDPKKLSTIVINLLSNAIKFTPSGGKIIVHLNRIEKKGGDFFLLKLKDNGSGIPKVELENIFNRFYQVDNSSTRAVEGTGIGLSLTKELTELMGGTIEVKSKVEMGSEFRVQLPITRNLPITNNELLPYHSLPATINTFPKEEGNLLDLPLVLIIEDNKDIANYLKICLEEKYNLIYAIDGQKGIELAYERIPDIIISDVMMPGKDGFEVCSILKNDERTDHIPIILLTAKASVGDKISGFSHGADAYLIKPFHKAELFTRLEQLILLREKMLKKVRQDSYSLFLKKQMEGVEVNFLKKAIDHIHLHVGDHPFGSLQLAHKLQLSESQVYRKLKAITGKSTAVFIRSVRLQKAKELILQSNDSISSIAYEVGFNDPSWFSRAFKEEFGYSPSELSK